jgi:hypothetical protein
LAKASSKDEGKRDQQRVDDRVRCADAGLRDSAAGTSKQLTFDGDEDREQDGHEAYPGRELAGVLLEGPPGDIEHE